jgi:protein tyrosine phosphatase
MMSFFNRFVSANLQVNKFKNRLVNILPFESSRVCLQPMRGIEGSDYINASFIDGYRYAQCACAIVKDAVNQCGASRAVITSMPASLMATGIRMRSSIVSLQPMRGIEGSDYINASFIDGYRYTHAQ